MLKRYQIELERNERDFATFLRSRKVTLSKNELRVLIASTAVNDRSSVFNFKNYECEPDLKGTRRKTGKVKNANSKYHDNLKHP